MSQHSFFDIVQVVTGLAVVIGLGLVVFELQQTRQIASVEQTNDLKSNYDTVTMAEIGEILPEALSRACEDPTDLTGAELVALNAYYLSNVIYVVYAYGDEESGISSRIPWQGYAKASFDSIFLTTVGQAWWEQQNILEWIQIPAEVKRIGDELLQSAPQECYLDGWRDAILDKQKGRVPM